MIKVPCRANEYSDLTVTHYNQRIYFIFPVSKKLKDEDLDIMLELAKIVAKGEK